MSNIRRLFVEKKDAFAVEAHGLLADLRNNLGMSNLTGMRIVNRYDVMGVWISRWRWAQQAYTWGRTTFPALRHARF